jgi:hypothetical protein
MVSAASSGAGAWQDRPRFATKKVSRARMSASASEQDYSATPWISDEGLHRPVPTARARQRRGSPHRRCEAPGRGVSIAGTLEKTPA